MFSSINNYELINTVIKPHDIPVMVTEGETDTQNREESCPISHSVSVKRHRDLHSQPSCFNAVGTTTLPEMGTDCRSLASQPPQHCTNH